MVVHIVCWKLKNSDKKQQSAMEIKRRLEGLAGKIPGLIRIEVGIDFSATPSSSDLALYSEFESRQTLQEYQVNPLHEEIKSFVNAVTIERRLVDYDK